MAEKSYSIRVVKILVIIIIALAVVIAGGVTYLIISNQNDSGEVVAIVNKTKIREDAFYRELKDRYGVKTLNEMIELYIIRDAGVKYNLSVNKLETKRELDKFRSEFSTEEDFLNYLEHELGMTLTQFTREIEHYLLWELLATKDVNISEEAVNLYYQKNIEKYRVPESFHLRQIVVATEEVANELIAEIKNGANFNQIARTMSLDYTSISTGGDLGYVYADSMMVNPAIIKQARVLENQGLAAVKVGDRYHIIQLLDHQKAYQYSYTEVKDQIKRELALSYAEPLGVVLEQLKEELGVEIKDKSLEIR